MKPGIENTLLINENKILDTLPIGVILFNSNFQIEYVNTTFYQMGLYANEEKLKSGSFNLLTDSLFDYVELEIEFQSIREGRFVEKEIKATKTASGGEIKLILKAVPSFENNLFTGGIIIVEDIQIATNLSVQSDIFKLGGIDLILSRITRLFFITDYSTKIKYVNGSSKAKLGRPVELLYDTELVDYLPINEIDNFTHAFSSAVDKMVEQKSTIHSPFADDNTEFNCTIIPLLNNGPEARFFAIVFQEVTTVDVQRKALESELNELKQYQIITEAATDAVVTINLQGVIAFWNKAAETLFGYSRSEVFGKSFGKISSAFDDTAFYDIVKNLNLYKTYRAKLPFVAKTGEPGIAQFFFSLAEFENNQSLIVVLCSDITEKEYYENELKLSEERLANIVDNSSDLICTFNESGKIVFANPAFYETSGYSVKESKDLHILSLFDKQFVTKNNITIQSLLDSGNTIIEIPGVTKEGKNLFFSAAISENVSSNSAGKLYNVILNDITLLKKESQELLLMQSVFEASTDGIAVIVDERFEYVNDAFIQLFGYSETAQLYGKWVKNVIFANSTKEAVKTAFFHAPSHGEIVAQRRDDTIFEAEFSTSSFTFHDKEFTVAFIRDITESKRAQKLIASSEEKYRNITENIDDFFWVAETLNGRLQTVFLTSAAKKITGYTEEEFLHDQRLYLKIIHPDDVKMLTEKLKKFLMNIYKKSEDIELRIIHKSGGTVWVRNRLNVVRTGTKIEKVYGLVSDISMQKRSEEERTKLTENLKKLNETKDRFISIISHDMRTPFSSILGFTEMLLQDDGLSKEERNQYLNFIQDSSKAMLNLVNSLLDWTRLQTGRIKFEPEKLDLADLIDSAITVLTGTAIQKQIKLINNVRHETLLFADRNLMLQVFSNLISNGLKFTKAGGKIEFSINGIIENRFVELSIKDSGVGIKEENLTKLFNVASKFSTPGTEGEKGTGLGLTLVHEIVEKHGGSIRVESNLNKGTNFILTLPMAAASILFVDDSNTERILYSKLLKSFTQDYMIETARNGEKALEKIEFAPPALVITDHNMPEMDGITLVKTLSKMPADKRPPVIVLSADIGQSERMEYAEYGVEHIFSKPVILAQFKEAVEKTLRRIPLKRE